MKMKYFTPFFLLIIFLLFNVVHSDAQVKITGKILSSDSTPLNRATIKVMNLSPEKEIKALITDSSGMFEIEKLSVGKYFLKISFIGYKPSYSGVFEVSGSESHLNMGDFILSPAGQDLKAVTVKANQKTIEQSEGKLVMNLKNSATAAGASALEALERLPNVIINRQNSTISLKGKEGSIVMINGKRTYIPNEALLQLLSGINASKIDKIELITNPSAAMDAEGNAGIINIIMARSKANGLNGSVEGQVGYGKGSVYNFNGDVNYKINKLGMYLSYSISRINQNQLSFNSRRNTFDGNDFLISTHSERNPIQRNHNLRFGIDYQINDTTSIGGSISAFDNKWSMSALNKTKFRIGANDTNLIITNSEINHWKHIGGNVYFQAKLKNNKAISLSLNYLSYHDNNPSFYDISYMDHQNNYLFG
ncbi:TonB-dependent receptor, partial [Terrimonas pollutisoli]|uniref:TonB-dependent receptor n=1 Tax=Terrimonas pollutisoli TaxID=3034147 RepID=UPI0023ECBC09